MLKPKVLLYVFAAMLFVTAIVMLNLAIMYSSIPHQQMGWAEFCGVNACWVTLLGILSVVAAESHGVAMRQLDIEERLRAIRES